MPALSIVLPTYNRWDRLQTVLEALAGQTVPADELEVIVVSDGSTDGTDEALQAGRAPRPIHLVRQPNQGPAVARNKGVEAATGDLVLFIDDDVVAEPGWAAAHLEMQERADRPTVVIGPLLTPPDFRFQPWVLWEQRMLEQQYRAMARGLWAPTARQFYTGNASIERDHFVRSGGFDPTFLRGEDVQLAYRLADDGMDFAFQFEAKAYHYAQRSFESWLSIASAYGRNDAIMWRDHGQDWLVPTVHREYRGRNPLTRVFTAIGVRRPELTAPAVDAVRPLADLADRLGVPALVQPALSAAYALTYRRALIEELGGRDAYRAAAAGTPPDPSLTG